jgi:5-methylcytosine-specific restriction enzyme subunit McrC
VARLVRLIEGRWRELRLSRADVATLQSRYAEAFEVRPTLTPGRYALRSRGRVGLLALPHTQLCIRAKIPLVRIGLLLDPAATLDTAHPLTVAAPDDWLSLLDWLADGLLRQVDALTRAGPACGYIATEGAWPYLRGRLDWARQSREPAESSRLLHCQADEWTVDIPANQIIRATLDLLAEHAATLSPAVRQQLTTLRAAWGGVSPRWPSEAERRLLVGQPQAARYASIHAACERLQACLHGAGVGFLLDMGRLFERFIARQLLATGLAVQCQSTFALTGSLAQPGPRFTPDLVVYGATGPTLVADTKWKHLHHGQPEPADLYQIIAYATMLGVGHAVLIYPGRANRTVAVWEVPPHSLRVSVLTVRLDGGPPRRVDTAAWLARRLRA